MKLADLTLGRLSTIGVAVDGEAAPEGLVGMPVRIFHPAESVDALLAAGPNTWSIRGLSAADQSDLERVLERGRPRVAWIAAAVPNVDRARMLQIHEFTSEYVWTEPVQLGVDDALLESLRRSKMIGASSVHPRRAPQARRVVPSPITRWPARDKRCIDRRAWPQPGRKRRVLAARPNAYRQRDAGSRRSTRIGRVTPLRRSAGSDGDPFRLMRGELSFVDATVAGAVTESSCIRVGRTSPRRGELSPAMVGVQRRRTSPRRRARTASRCCRLRQVRAHGRWRLAVSSRTRL